MREITDISEQREEIERYHTSGNHRGIDETIWKMRRDIYFPFMKNRVTQVINACETCQTLKYDRQPQKVVFRNTETPCKPLNIAHTDLYTINKNYVITIIDKFSRFAVGYTIPARDSLNIVKSIKKFISQYGVPKKIICDQGAE